MLTEFKFLFPIVDTRIKGKYVLLTDLHVTAYAGLSTTGEIIDMKIRKITHFDKDERLGSNIASFLQCTDMKLFDRIYKATEHHALQIFKPRMEAKATPKPQDAKIHS